MRSTHARWRVAFVAGVLASTVGVVLAPGPAATAASTGQPDPQTGMIVSEEPAGNTPDILDGTVYSITDVGDLMVVGGSFTQVRNPNSSAVISRSRVFAFDKQTGRVSTTFAPQPNGTVYKVLPATDGTSVYIGGRFTSAAGRTVKNLIRANLEPGAGTPALTAGFAPPNLSGDVRDLSVVDNRLFVAGKFTHIGGKAQKALGTLDATTGAYDPFFTGVFTGVHRPERTASTTNVLQIAIDPANEQLVAVGNFTAVDSVARSQIVKFDISGATYALSPWFTNLFTSACSSNFDSYVSDVEFSPDGSFFAVATTGAWGGVSGSMNGTVGCDVVARFEADSQVQSRATWTAYPGGDSTWSVEVTDKVVYAGGHQKYQNNPASGNDPGPGAVARTGIAALNAVNGMPYSWNPTRTRGVGVQDMHATSDGLYVGSDTELIGKTPGNRYHPRIALLPLATGKTLPTIRAYTLPGDVYTVASGQSVLRRRGFDGDEVTAVADVPGGLPNAPSWGSVVGAFMVDGVLYTATTDGALTKRTFDGTAYGAPSLVNAADALVYQTEWHNSVPSITSLFYSGGRMYFTRSGQNVLYNRPFETESDVVSQQVFSSTPPAGVSYTSMRGAFVAGGSFYFATSSTPAGRLFRMSWSGTAPTGTPVLVSGPGADTQTWGSRAMFPFQGPPAGPVNVPPTASFTVSCPSLTCTFDASASDDPDGTVKTYTWEFGDGSQTESGPSATISHAYAAAGPRTVTLTVTDNQGAGATTTRTADPTEPQPSAISFVGAGTRASNGSANHPVTVPSSAQAGDTLLLLFTAAAALPTYTPPSGWQEVAAQNGDQMAGRAFVKTATAADADATVTTTSSSITKSNSTVLVYRGVDVTNPITAATTSVETGSALNHTTPTVEAPDGTGWLVSYWSDRSSATTGWAAPGSETQRSTNLGSGGGRITSITADGNQPVQAGTRGGLTATANGAGRGLMMSILLKPS